MFSFINIDRLIYNNFCFIAFVMDVLCPEVFGHIMSFLEEYNSIVEVFPLDLLNHEYVREHVTFRVRYPDQLRFLHLIKFNLVIWLPLTEFPVNLQCRDLTIIGCNTISVIPEGCHFRKLTIDGKNTIKMIPNDIQCDYLTICGRNTISVIPDNLNCKYLIVRGRNTIDHISNNCQCDRIRIGGSKWLNINLDLFNWMYLPRGFHIIKRK